MQYVNTTDTWQNPGDASLMDGGKIGDLHLVLALSVNPSSTGLTGKVTDGKYIWGDQIDYSGTHVDHLFYMSAKPGAGVPGHFTVADAAGNTDYTTHCGSYKTEGIEYKMADGNACSSIWGLNNSDSTDDVFSDSSDWVDYKTYKGSKGVHNTKYDSFYETLHGSGHHRKSAHFQRHRRYDSLRQRRISSRLLPVRSFNDRQRKGRLRQRPQYFSREGRP